ncbi:MAG: hypothetical protein ABIR18_01625 [Chitinophagaceae bacterium]
MKQSLSIFKTFSFAILSLSLFLASCSKNHDKDTAIQGAEFVGQYLVVDPSETYTIKIESLGGNKFQIKEFGGFLNVPVKAVVENNTIQIPTQTFTNPNGKSLTIVGIGALSTKVKKDDTITFDYSVSGYTSYDGDFEGTRK